MVRFEARPQEKERKAYSLFKECTTTPRLPPYVFMICQLQMKETSWHHKDIPWRQWKWWGSRLGQLMVVPKGNRQPSNDHPNSTTVMSLRIEKTLVPLWVTFHFVFTFHTIVSGIKHTIMREGRQRVVRSCTSGPQCRFFISEGIHPVVVIFLMKMRDGDGNSSSTGTRDNCILH